MSTSEKSNKGSSTNLKDLLSVKGSKGKNDAPAQGLAAEVKAVEKKLGKKMACCKNCCKIIFVVLSVLAVLMSIAEIAVTVSTAIFTKLYGTEHSGRLVAMVVLALLAAITISILVNALVAVFRNHAKPLHATAIVLLVVAVIQAVVLGVAVKVTPEDEVQLAKALMRSFQLAKDNNPRHSAIWAATQNKLTCCGLLSADDYRTTNLPDYFVPDVPVSCCPGYDPFRSDLVQEREREVCKSRKAYYKQGCERPVVEGFKSSANLVIGLTVTLLIIEIILAINAAALVRHIKKQKVLKQAETETRDNNNP